MDLKWILKPLQLRSWGKIPGFWYPEIQGVRILGILKKERILKKRGSLRKERIQRVRIQKITKLKKI